MITCVKNKNQLMEEIKECLWADAQHLPAKCIQYFEWRMKSSRNESDTKLMMK